MRKLKIVEHISLDGVIQVAGPGDDSDFPYFAEPEIKSVSDCKLARW